MRYLFFYLVLFFFSCRNEPGPTKPSVNLTPRSGPVTLRAAPGEKSPVIGSAAVGSRLGDLLETSSFVTPLQLDNTWYQEPWIKVSTSQGQTGWVYAATLKPMDGTEQDWRLEKRIRCFFGQGVLKRRNNWIAHLGHLENVADYANGYREGLALRDTMMQMLARRTEPNEAGFKVDFSWLPDIMPGFVFQWLDDGKRPYLFADYRYWALKTNGDEVADDFSKLCYKIFPADSIESFFPCWMIQTDVEAGCSRLGEGKHVDMLKAIAAFNRVHPDHPFGPELTRLKEAVCNDMLDKNTCYWQDKDLIIKELQKIVEESPACLSARDKLALQQRLTMFQNPAANGISVNKRGG